ncbi:penicillin-binding protein activator [Marinimicrobium alkaliphilum]|uniref:penicillin-binding protein activator n=1 Tax=Marinimicrobium alkaliphilum TaxID=2202654 RepID=UPI000DBA2823|nr:penicillin-binding protein activator [Marinimicrobium alkaliphilum]
MVKQGLSLGLIATLLALLAACGTQPPHPDDAEPHDPEAATAEATRQEANALVEQARASQSPEREQQLLRAAELLAELEDTSWARNLLTSIDSGRLDNQRYVRHTLLLSRIAVADGSYFLAQRILTNPRLEQQWRAMNPDQEAELRELRAQTFAYLGDTGDSLEERVRLGALLTDPTREAENRESLWRNLMALSRQDLTSRAESTEDATLRGWYQLAAIAMQQQSNLEQQLADVDAWQAEWRGHPADQNLPDDLRLLRELVANQPRQIALLLPQQGRLAQSADAVRDGFFAAYYHAREQGIRVPQVRQYDTSNGDVLELYDQAVAEGAELVIGPLDKDQVNELALMPGLPVPVLSLNYSDYTDDTTATGLYQFGLAAEDEARQAARQGYLDGHRRALVLTPNSSWAERSAAAFADTWHDLGGDVVHSSHYSSEVSYSGLVQRVLLTRESENRRQDLHRLFGTRVEFEPRRRQDVDMIFLIASPAQARQIKPALAFHYAGNLPVYSTSHIYAGVADAGSDRDLNGIRFNTLPWLFDDSNPERQSLDEHARGASVYGRLHALGVDAFRLLPRLPQLEQIPQSRLYGATGTLRLLEDRRIEREQIWAEFRSGLARPLPTLAIEQPEADEE